MRLLLAVAVWVAAVAGALALGSDVESAVGPTGTSSGASFNGSSGGSAGAAFDASAVGAADPQSLFRSANFARGLAAARAQLGPDARLDNFALYPGYLSLTAVKGNGEVDFYVNAQGNSHTVSTPGSPGSDTLFSLAHVNAAAPATLARRIAVNGHTPTSQLHYMVARVDSITNRFSWLVYPLAGNRVEYFEARGTTGPLLEYLRDSAAGPQPLR